MSLDVYLSDPTAPEGTPRRAIFIRRDGATKEVSREEWDRMYPDREPVTVEVTDHYLFHANITHNLNKMASECGLYEPLWRPGDLGVTKAGDLCYYLSKGLQVALDESERLSMYNPDNGWGTYEQLVRFTLDYFFACKRFPDAIVEVSI